MSDETNKVSSSLVEIATNPHDLCIISITALRLARRVLDLEDGEIVDKLTASEWLTEQGERVATARVEVINER